MTSHSDLKIKVLQYMYGDLEFHPVSERINRHYCKRHGYDYVLNTEEPRPDRHVTWHKVPVILKEMQDCDYLLFLDADAIFYGQEFSIERELIPLLEDKGILMAQDIGCETGRWMPGLPNSGVILTKVNGAVKSFFDYWNYSSEIDEASRWTWPPEQLALWRVVMPKWGDLLHVHTEYYLIQGLYGQFIRHYMRLTDQKRLDLMEEFCSSRNIP